MLIEHRLADMDGQHTIYLHYMICMRILYTMFKPKLYILSTPDKHLNSTQYEILVLYPILTSKDLFMSSGDFVHGHNDKSTISFYDPDL